MIKKILLFILSAFLVLFFLSVLFLTEQKIPLFSLIDKDGSNEKTFLSVLPKEYVVLFYIDIPETYSSIEVDYCHLSDKRPCGVILDDFEIEVHINSRNIDSSQNLKDIIRAKRHWSAGRIISYEDAVPERKFLFKQPYLYERNKGLGWIVGKIDSSVLDIISIDVEYKILADKWRKYNPRFILVTPNSINSV